MHVSRILGRRGLAALLVATGALAGAPTVAQALVRPATPASFAGVWRAAEGGDTILLASGNYGRFDGGRKPSMVTITRQPGAEARMELAFRGAQNIALDGLRLGEIEMQDDTRDVTVRNSTIDGQTVLRTGTLANSNILFDHNHHTAWDKCGNCGEARFFLPEKTSQPSGVTIQNSKFGPGGNSDGIQNGSNGTRILNNEFTGIKQIDGDDVHADSIQLYGSERTLIKGNYFHDVSVGVMCPDGCDHETVEDNVFAVDGSPYAVTWLSDNGSVIRHNTFLDHGICDYDQPCGVLYLGNKSGDPVSRGTRVVDNIITRICVCDGRVSGLAEENHNLLRHGGNGPDDLRGAPTYVGGPKPGGYTGFALADGSLGKGDASDGDDRGARIGAGPPSTPGGAPAIVRVRSSLRGAIGTRRLKLAIRTPRSGTLTFWVRLRPGRRAKRGGIHSRKLIRLRRVKVSRRKAGVNRVSVVLPRRVRRILYRSRDASISVRFKVGSQARTVSGLRLRR